MSTTSDFTSNVTTVYNTDNDNSVGEGTGTEPGFTESKMGREVFFPPVTARYVRLWSSDPTHHDNRYVEVEVYGMGNPAAGMAATTDGTSADLSQLTDGNYRTGTVNVGSGLKYVQIDLRENKVVDSLRVWRDFSDKRRYHDVVFQVSTDPTFATNVTTVFNNDQDGSAGLGAGTWTDGEYNETATGKIVHFNPVNTRYVRLYSNGNTMNDNNHYTEIMVGQGSKSRQKEFVKFESDATFPTKDPFTVKIVRLNSSVRLLGFTPGVTVTNGVRSNWFQVSAGVWTFTVTPDADYEGDVTVTLPAGEALVGDVPSLATSKAFAVDTKAPVFSTAAVNGNTLTLTYHEDLDADSTPAASAYAVMAGPAGSLAAASLASSNPVTVSGATVTLKLASAVALSDTVTVSYTAPGTNKLQDVAGNLADNLPAQAVTNQTVKPTVTIASTASFPTKNAFGVTFEFSEAVTGFVIGDITVAGGTASNFSGSGTSYAATVTPMADYAGGVTVSVAADVVLGIVNSVGNGSASKTFAADTKDPALAGAAVNGNALTLTYDEVLDADSTPAGSAYAVKAGPSANPMTVSLASTNPVTVSGATVTLKLASAVAAGATVTVSYTAPGSGKLQDAAGNAAGNLDAQAVVNKTGKPTVAIESAATFPTKDTFSVTLTFSAAVTELVVGDITVTKGMASNFSGSGTTYAATVTPEADYAGDVTVSVAADVVLGIVNSVGNAAASKTFAVDTKAPAFQTAVVTGNTLTLTYDEDPDADSTPAGSAYAVMAGPAGSLEVAALADTNPVTVSSRTVTLTLTAAVAVSDTVTVDYTAPTGANAKLQDTLGNAAANLSAQAVTNETAKPTVAIESAADFPTKDAFSVTFEFSESVTEFVVGDITVTKGMASNFSGLGTSYAVTVTPEADYAGAVTVSVAADVATANGVGNAAASESFAADTKAPAFQTAAVNGNTLTLTYDEVLDADSTPAGSAYAVKGGAVGKPDDGVAGAHEPGDGVGQDGDAEAVGGGGGERHGDGGLHGAGDEQAAGRGGQRGGEPVGPGGLEQYDEADGNDRECGYVPDEGCLLGDGHVLGAPERSFSIGHHGHQGHAGQRQ